MALKITDRFSLSMLKGDGNYALKVSEVTPEQVSDAMDTGFESYIKDPNMALTFTRIVGLSVCATTWELKFTDKDTLVVAQMGNANPDNPRPFKFFSVTFH